jgi:N-acetylglucosaminyldiphosphoundecaprenol N-acetyl-beta-D-mannosaminyltransferase
LNSTAESQNLFISKPILGVNVSASSYETVVDQCLAWGHARQSRALFFANVHVVMEALDNPVFRLRLNRSDIVSPDGMPLVWALRMLGVANAERVYGPDATLAMLAAAEGAGMPIGFYGGSQAVLDNLISRVRLQYPSINIVFCESPPFRSLTPQEDAVVVNRITSSNARVLFVGLGCPKQENWIMEHLGRIPAVMFGVGAAFDFLAGAKPQAPRWMMRSGLEWTFRLAVEPRRLWKRYLINNPRFIWNISLQFLGLRRYKFDA